jgi:hypothetical protein
MRRLQTATLTDQNISAYLLAGTYTADADRAVMIRVVLDQVQGAGDYLCYATVRQAGAGSSYMVGPISTFTVPAAVTAIAFASLLIPLETTDVLSVYVKGLGTDTATVDIICRFYELTYTRPTVAGRTIDVSATGEVGLDFDNRLDTTGILPNAAAGSTSGLPLKSDLPAAAPTVGQIDTQLSATHGAGAWTNSAGSGAHSYTGTITDTGGTPLDGVRVQLSTDAGGTNRVYEAYTNALGAFAMYPDAAGTYYRWVELAGYTGTQGAAVVVA